ncbi:MAG: hypothetical protein HQK83_07250 [Fibrobacteria bacterium]|nr:hypothetical protein [Fibrobacteria bacterium]
MIIASTLSKINAQNFAGEVYLIGYSVPVNGSAGTLPSSNGAPSQIINFPAHISAPNFMRFELSTLPMFGDLAKTYTGAIALALDSNTEISLFTAMMTNDDIFQFSSLEYTKAERFSDPAKRPQACGSSCNALKNVDYLSYLNVKRKFSGLLPRLDFAQSPIPIHASIGANIKYFMEELEGADYIAQNINLDLAANVIIDWAHDGQNESSPRIFSLDIAGFELLQTPQYSKYASESIKSRIHLGFNWDENLFFLDSRVKFGVRHMSEWGNLPALGVEWQFKNLLFVRAGYHKDFVTGGLSLTYKIIALHYSLSHHYLAFNPYQVSMQIQTPW